MAVHWSDGCRVLGVDSCWLLLLLLLPLLLLLLRLLLLLLLLLQLRQLSTRDNTVTVAFESISLADQLAVLTTLA